jgi:adenosylcobinamide-GDP ribazoletransferase
LNAWFADFRTAVMLLTRLPAGANAVGAAPDMSRAAWAYPLVGVLVGGIGAAVFLAALGLGAPPGVTAILVVGAQALATGALHEDGLVDTVDGLGGGRSRAQKLEIMRDSRIGTFGALALLLSIAMRVELLRTLASQPELAILALVAVGGLSRGSMVALLAAMRPARSDGLGHGAASPGGGQVALSLLIAGIVSVILLGLWPGLGTIFGTGLATLVLGLLARRQLGGYTGDVLGAGQQLSEIAGLLALVLWLG